MQMYETEICQYSESIWKNTLDLDINQTDEKFSSMAGESVLAGCVHISGEWEGAVVLDCPLELAKKATAIMFKLSEEELTSDLVQDALGELTNMTGGNLKSLLPEPCYLSLPTVSMTEYGFKIPGSELLTMVTFKCWGYKFKVSILKKIDNT